MLVTFLIATLLIVGGTYIFFTYQAPASDSTTVLGHRNDTVLLSGDIDSFGYSNITVRQCIAQGDDYHDANIYVVKKEDIVLKTEQTTFQFPHHYQDSPSYKSGIQDYLYLLSNSSFTYRVCLSSTTDHDQNVTYFVFDSAANYGSYVSDQENGEMYSMFSRSLIARRNSQLTCTELSLNTTHPSYYFMMMRSPANITYSYNFTLHKVAYDTTNMKQDCRISDLNTCEVPLPNADFKHVTSDVLAYIQPGYLESSIVTHFCLSTYGGSTTLKKLSYISGSFFGLGAALLIVISALFFFTLLFRMCRNHKFSEERDRLLGHY